MTAVTNHQNGRRMVIGGIACVVVGLLLILGVTVPTRAADLTTVGGTIALHNNTASPGSDCPAGGAAYWHFVLAPNNGSASFVTITLNLTTETRSFSGAEIIRNGTQADNVFVAVPAGHTLTELVTSGSSATYTGTTPNQFNLSSVCEGKVPPSSTTTTTTTTPSSTTTTTTASSTTTTPSSTTTTPSSTTTTPESTTTTTTPSSTTTTTTASSTTTTPSSTTTTPESTTTTTPGSTTTTSGSSTTTTAPESPSSVSRTTAVATTTTSIPTQVLGESTSKTTLPVTGTAAALIASLGILFVAAGIILLVASRRTAGPATDVTT